MIETHILEPRHTESRYWQGFTSSGSPRADSASCIFQHSLPALLGLRHITPISVSTFMETLSLLCVCQNSFCLSLIKPPVMAFRAHPFNSVKLTSLKMLKLITSEKSHLPNNVTFTGPGIRIL